MIRITTLASVSALQLLAAGTPAHLGLWILFSDILGLQWRDNQLGQEIVRLVLIIDLLALSIVCLQLLRRRLATKNKTPMWAPSLCVFGWQLVAASAPENIGLWTMWAVVLGLPLHDSHLGKEFAKLVLSIDLLVLTFACLRLAASRMEGNSNVFTWVLQKLFLPASPKMQYFTGDEYHIPVIKEQFVSSHIVVTEDVGCSDVVMEVGFSCSDVVIEEEVGCREVVDFGGSEVNGVGSMKKDVARHDRMSEYSLCEDDMLQIY